jgi:hypothetical protein
MAIIGSIFGSIAGAFFKDEYDRILNKNILEKKGDRQFVILKELEPNFVILNLG